MLEELLVEEARERKRIFENLNVYLKKVVEIVKRLDEDAEVYMFGSVVEGRYLLSSDIDIIIVTYLNPGKVLAELWNNGIREPFEVHVVVRDKLDIYRRRAKLVRVDVEN